MSLSLRWAIKYGFEKKAIISAVEEMVLLSKEPVADWTSDWLAEAAVHVAVGLVVAKPAPLT